MSIINTFVQDGHSVNYDWAWHLAHKNLTPIPGQDYNVPADHAVRAPCAGWASADYMDDGLHLVSIAYGNDAITIRELGSLAGKFDRNVAQGEVIGYASHTLSPHIEYDHSNGTYSPFENYVTPITPPAPQPVEEELMPFMIYVLTSKGAMFGHALVSLDLKSFVAISSGAASNLVAQTYNKDAQVTAADWNAFKAAAGLTPDVIP